MNDFFNSYNLSLARFHEALQDPKTVKNRDSASKRFEITFELAWKAMKQYVTAQGVLTRSPKETMREAYRLGLIDDEQTWFDIIEMRNMTVHNYNEDMSDVIYGKLPLYYEKFLALQEKLK